MKKTIIPFLFCLMAFSNFAQEQIPYTPAGYCDTVFDQSGKRYALSDIILDPPPVGAPVFPPSTASCQAGYFILHFGPNSGCIGSGSPFSNRRSVLCQLFTDISCFIRSPLNSACHSTTNTSTFVHFYIDSLGTTTSGPLAVATSFYSFPLAPQSGYPGIAEGAVHKTIVSGVNSYINVVPPISIFAASNNYYHGLIKINFNYSWNYNLSSSTVPSTQYEMYSVMLHEAMHALGFNSLISPNGGSLFGSQNNYYTKYDTYLKDYLGTPIITNGTGCAATSYSYNTSSIVSSLTGSYCTGSSDITYCPTGPRFVDGTIDVKVYHPACFELGSTFSHFEDICTVPASFSSTCPAFPSGTYNNLYYVMSNASNTGNCYLKRHLQEEERYVLCDLGYSVEPTYSSPVAGAAYTYTGGACSGNNIWGVNDGLNSTGYAYVGSSNINIPITQIISNDAPSTTSISCVSFVYNYPGITLTVASGSVQIGHVGGPVQYCGPMLLQYIPMNSLGQAGNVTYIYAYFPCIGGCSPPNLCNVVQNGGFESLTAATSTVCLGVVNSTYVNCWDYYCSTPDFLNGNCSSGSPYGTSFFLPLTSTWNGTVTNKVCVGMWGSAGPSPIYGYEVVKSSLSTPPVPTNTYVIGFWAYQLSVPGRNFPAKDMVMTFALGPNMGITPNATFPYPTGLTTLYDFTLTAANVNNWKYYTATVIYSGPANQGALTIGCNHVLTTQAASLTANMGFYTLIDDISILPVGSSAAFTPPAAICQGSSVLNLALYTTLTGTFSGTGVTQSGSNYNFNAAPNNTLAPGSYPIVFTYTTGTGCTNSTVSYINIAGISASSVFCNYNNYTLTASGYPAGTTYTWLPSNLNTPTIAVSGSVSTTYTLLSNYGSCNSATFTPNIMPNTIIISNPGPWCAASASIQPLGVSIPSYTVPTAITQTWSVNSYTVPTIFVTFNNTINPVYTVTTSAAGCTNIATYTATWIPKFSISVSTPPVYCSNIGTGVTISATASPSSGITFTWMPGSLVGASQTVSPSSPTVYTVTAGSGSLCTITNTVAVNVSSVCCSSSNYLSSAPPTGTYSGFYAINQNVTISNPVVFNGEFKIAQDVTITIAPGGTLTLINSHLYSCGANMWGGIIVNNGGRVVSPRQYNPIPGVAYDNSVLIEDAVNAIFMDGCTNTSTVQTDFNISMESTTFNKNFIGINYRNYNYAVNAPVLIDNCVFSCRSLTFTPTTWPAPTYTAGGLRYPAASTPTTGLASPYDLQGTPVVALKAPNAANSASTGIQLDNVGAISGSTFYCFHVGSETTDTDFNLFDAMGYGIDATNSNLISANNVFQNAQQMYVAVQVGHHIVYSYVAGSGIRQTINTLMNAKLDLRTTGTNSNNPSYGNRFWNCYWGVEAYNSYQFNVEQAIFRSTQTTAGGTNILPGYTGIYLNTNRFQYNMKWNEFTNICNAINIPIVSGNYNVGAGTQTGIYAAQLVVNNNTFAPQTSTATALGSNFMNQAVSITSPNYYPWQFGPGSGLYIQSNSVNRAYRGVAVSGLASYTCLINNNTINLTDDNMLFLTQRAIDVSGTLNKMVVTTNTLSGSNITNTLVSLAYFGNNVGTSSPSITCNVLSNSYNAFNFDNANNGAFWRGNTMQTHARGLVLANSATIGVQGSSGQPQDNQWLGTWTLPANAGTFVDNSNAVLSPVWYKSSLALPTPTGNVLALQRYGAPNTLSLTTGSFACTTGGGGGGSMIVITPTNSSSSQAQSNNAATSAEQQYVGENNLYRYFDANPSVKNSNTTYSGFYNGKANSSMDKFMQVEAALYNHQTTQAQLVNNAVNITNAVEGNYQSFYTLYAKQQSGNFTNADSTTLINLAKLCPGIDGAVIYQARALYNAIYKTVRAYNENCDPQIKANARLINSNTNVSNLNKSWSVNLYPNPTDNYVNVVSSSEKENLNISITDVSGKIVFVKRVITSNFICNLELDLLPGAYFVTVTNDKNDKTTKKLIIVK